MTRDEQLAQIEGAAGRIQKACPQNVILTGKGKFRGAISATVRDAEIAKEQILYALDVVQEEIGRIYTLTSANIDG